MMSKTHTIEAIMGLNPTANPGFLAEFAPDELSRYLFRLADVTPMSRTVDEADPPSFDGPWKSGRHAGSAFA